MIHDSLEKEQTLFMSRISEINIKRVRGEQDLGPKGEGPAGGREAETAGVREEPGLGREGQ